MKRRVFLKSGLAALALAGAAGASGTFRSLMPGRFSLITGTQSVQAAAGFRELLPIPPLLEDMSNTADSVHFAMQVQAGSREFFPGMSTPTLGYNGNFLGPTIRVRNGQQFRMHVQNELHQTTSLHWHGLHVPAKWDGGPRQPIAAGAGWDPEFTIKQQAATLWYHPHAMGLTGEQVYNGLAGLFFIEDEVSDSLDIPRAYGRDDIPVVLQDRRFFVNGQFAYVQGRHDVINGVIGNYLLVNGVMQPRLKVHAGMVRLRLVNGSNSSIYTIRLSGSKSFQMIASDGGFLERPLTMDSIILSAGERAEVVVDFSNNKLDSQLSLLVDQLGGNSFEAMAITVDRPAETVVKIPSSLLPLEKIPASEATVTRKFIMETMGGGRMGMMGGGLSINGRKMDLNRVDARIKLGSTEIWEISNRSAMMMSMPHSMHLHDVQFQILSRNGRPPAAHEQGRKDTVLVMPGETVRIISRFRDYKGIYMYHCHLLEHEDEGMMGQFEVVA